MADLYHATREHLALVQAVRDALGDDEQAIADTIEGESRIEDAIAATIRESRAIAAMRDGLTDLMNLMKKRAERLNARCERLEAAALQAAEECGVTKITVPDFTASIGAGQGKVVIVDEAQLPQDCLRTKYEINRSLIRERLLTGVDVPGAELSNPISHWIVRVV